MPRDAVSGAANVGMVGKNGLIRDQCAVLFSMIYTVYSSDISKICNESQFLMYADDTCLMFTNDNIKELLCREVNANLEKLSDWCYFNKLLLNPSKCSYILEICKCYSPTKLLVRTNHTCFLEGFKRIFKRKTMEYFINMY